MKSTQNTHYVYGVYNNENCFAQAYDRLCNSGLKDIYVLKNSEACLENVSASIKHPMNHYLLMGALAGAVIASASSLMFNMPAFVDFELLTPVMVGICGAALGAYLGMYMCFALTGLDQRHVMPQVFDAIIPAGSFVLGVSVCDNLQKQIAIDCLNEEEMVELIIKNEMLDLPYISNNRLEKELQLAA